MSRIMFQIMNNAGFTFAIEVKSGRKKSAKALDAFVEKFPNARRIVITVEKFLQFSQER